MFGGGINNIWFFDKSKVLFYITANNLEINIYLIKVKC